MGASPSTAVLSRGGDAVTQEFVERATSNLVNPRFVASEVQVLVRSVASSNPSKPPGAAGRRGDAPVPSDADMKVGAGDEDVEFFLPPSAAAAARADSED